jgi:hypothetical protein
MTAGYTFHRQKLRFGDEQILAKVPNLRKVSNLNLMQCEVYNKFTHIFQAQGVESHESRTHIFQ